jgi:hypothetical protein
VRFKLFYLYPFEHCFFLCKLCLLNFSHTQTSISTTQQSEKQFQAPPVGVRRKYTHTQDGRSTLALQRAPRPSLQLMPYHWIGHGSVKGRQKSTRNLGHPQQPNRRKRAPTTASPLRRSSGPREPRAGLDHQKHPTRLSTLQQNHNSQLLHNSQLAADATDTWTWASCKTSPDIPFAHAAYYNMRKIVLSHSYPQARLQNSLCATLRSNTKEEADRLDMFCLFLRAGTASQRDRDKHGIERPVADWEAYEREMSYAWLPVVFDSWQYTARVIRALVRDKTAGGTTLAMFLGIRATVSDTVAT